MIVVQGRPTGGLVLADIAERLTVCATPLCGGLLVPAGPRFRHVDACLDCYELPSGVSCEIRWAHSRCNTPDPALCLHQCRWPSTCQSPVTVLDIPCAAGLAPRECCGCCLELLDLERGRP